MIRSLPAGVRTKLVRRSALAAVVAVGLLLAVPSDAGSTLAAAPRSSAETTTAPPAAWAQVDHALARLGPNVGFLAARVSPAGRCEPVHEIAPRTARPTASQFKLFVLGALAEQITHGRISWDQTLTVDDAVRSLGNGPGSLQLEPNGTKVSVEQVATKMISISDNTAADMLIGLVGRKRVEAQVGKWAAQPVLNKPFLTTRQIFLLHYARGLADRYLATPRGRRAAFLASSVDPLPLSAIGSAVSTDPRYIDTIEWFASPTDICRAFAGLQQLSKNPALSPQLSTVLSREDFGLDLDPSEWSTVWFKGGSEPGVLTLGWLATNRFGETFVVQAMVSDPDKNLPDTQFDDLTAIARSAFAQLG